MRKMVKRTMGKLANVLQYKQDYSRGRKISEYLEPSRLVLHVCYKMYLILFIFTLKKSLSLSLNHIQIEK